MSPKVELLRGTTPQFFPPSKRLPNPRVSLPVEHLLPYYLLGIEPKLRQLLVHIYKVMFKWFI